MDPPYAFILKVICQVTELFAFSSGTICASKSLWYHVFLCLKSRFEMNSAGIVRMKKNVTVLSVILGDNWSLFCLKFKTVRECKLSDIIFLFS